MLEDDSLKSLMPVSVESQLMLQEEFLLCLILENDQSVLEPDCYWLVDIKVSVCVFLDDLKCQSKC